MTTKLDHPSAKKCFFFNLNKKEFIIILGHPVLNVMVGIRNGSHTVANSRSKVKVMQGTKKRAKERNIPQKIVNYSITYTHTHSRWE